MIELPLPILVVNMHRSPLTVADARRDGRFVLVDRTTIWGNPYSHQRGTTAKYRVGTREEAVRLYEAWLPEQAELMAQLPTLNGKVLGCHCLPLLCHAVVLARFAQRACSKSTTG